MITHLRMLMTRQNTVGSALPRSDTYLRSTLGGGGAHGTH